MKKTLVSELPEYRVWASMKSRCIDVGHSSYKSYGARGIKICERWKKFKNFFEDMGARPTSKHSIDRIDNNGNYEPGNCRWATTIEQGYNKRNTVYVTVKDKQYNISQLHDLFGIKKDTIHNRIKNGVSFESLGSSLPCRSKRYSCKYSHLYKEWLDLRNNGVSLCQIAKEYGCYTNSVVYGIAKITKSVNCV